VGLPARFSLTVAYVPPVEVFGIKSNLGAVAIERPLWEGERWRLGARLYGQIGTSEGAFTCTEEDAAYGSDDFENNPFGCEAPSSDQATLRYTGLELGAAYRVDPNGLSLHLAGAANYFDNRFQVDARTFGFRDRTLLLADGSTWSVAAGVTVPMPRRTTLGVELFYTPLEVARLGRARETDPLFNARMMLAHRFR
jgi:hypothetical protein